VNLGQKCVEIMTITKPQEANMAKVLWIGDAPESQLTYQAKDIKTMRDQSNLVTCHEVTNPVQADALSLQGYDVIMLANTSILRKADAAASERFLTKVKQSRIPVVVYDGDLPNVKPILEVMGFGKAEMFDPMHCEADDLAIAVGRASEKGNFSAAALERKAGQTRNRAED
jgi:hypothetical protein